MRHLLASSLSLLLLSAPALAHDGDHGTGGGGAERLGTVSFANSCAPDVQASLTRAVALLHSFWFNESEKAFDDVLARDPTCVIATWGSATTLVGNVFGEGPTKPEAERAQAKIKQGLSLPAKTPRERAYLDAIAAYYDRFEARTPAARMSSLSDAFADVAQRFPDDDEAQIFGALYLVATQPLTDKTYARTLKAAAILEAQFKKNENHPGISHYLIHAYDFPSLADRGQAAALRYAMIVPDAYHALHMPSHIFTRTGDWKESIAVNQRSAVSAKASKVPSSELHAMDYMVHAQLQLGQDKNAAAVRDEAARIAAPGLASDYAKAAIPARYAIERSRWNEAAALPLPATAGKFRYTDAMTLFARALGAARSGKPEQAKTDLERLAAIVAELKAANSSYWATEVEVQRLTAAAWIAFAEGQRAEALNGMRAAADLEDKSEKAAISPGRIIPARELLGDMLRENSEPAAALAAYETSLVHDPKRLRSFFGAATAAVASGDAAKAKDYFTRLAAMADPASERPEIVEARKSLAAK